MNQRDFLNPGTFKLLAGTALAAGTFFQGIAGKAWPVTAIDYAANASVNTEIIAFNYSSATGALSDGAAAGSSSNPNNIVPHGSDGSYYTLQQNIVGGTPTGFNVVRYYPGATQSTPLQKSVDLIYNNGQTLAARLGRCPVTGNLALVWADSASTLAKFAVFDQNLSTVKAATSLGATSAGSDDVGLVILPTGGFVTVWHDATNKQTSIKKWTDTGAADPTNPGPVVDKTWVGTATNGPVIGGLGLTNGKIALAYKSIYTTDNGTWLSVLNADLTVSLAAVRIATTTTAQALRPVLAQAGATFAVWSETEGKAYIRDLTGAAVVTYTAATAYVGASSTLVSDFSRDSNGAYYSAVGVTAANFPTLEKFDAAGVKQGQPAATPTSMAGTNTIGAVYMPFGYVAFVRPGSALGPKWCTFDVRNTQPIVGQDTTIFSATANAASSPVGVAYVGDGVIAAKIADGSTGRDQYEVKKVIKSAILGVSRKAAAVNTKVASLAGKYAADIVPIGGTGVPTLIDHSNAGGIKAMVWDVSVALSVGF